MERGQVGYLIVLDLDSFKKINDTNGHLFGDAVLCSFADEMNKLFPKALKGRIGGDEFVCYVEAVSYTHLVRRVFPGFISNVPPHSKPSLYFGHKCICRWQPVSPYAP